MSDSYIALVEKSIDERAQQYQELLRLHAELAAVTAERDALAAELARKDPNNPALARARGETK